MIAVEGSLTWIGPGGAGCGFSVGAGVGGFGAGVGGFGAGVGLDTSIANNFTTGSGRPSMNNLHPYVPTVSQITSAPIYLYVRWKA